MLLGLRLKFTVFFHRFSLSITFKEISRITIIEQALSHEGGNIVRAINEWATSDSIACLRAIADDDSCIKDIFDKAGDISLLSKLNLKWLEKNEDFYIISPGELALK